MQRDHRWRHCILLCFVLSAYFVLVLPSFFSFADTNLQRGYRCSDADYTFNEDTLETNLKSLLDSLASNEVDHHGYYQGSVGKKGNKVYGTVLCRGDISVNNCSNCILDSIKVASHDCPKSRDVSVWFTWCFLRYSNESFFGSMQSPAVAITNDTDFDDPSVVSQGLPFMSELAAMTPEQPFMFKTAVLNVSKNGKRYGMAQCTRDISRIDCRTCLDAQLVSFRNVIGNKKRWEIYGSNCFMWYNDYQFYSNVSTILSAARRASSCRSYIAAAVTVLVSATILLVF